MSYVLITCNVKIAEPLLTAMGASTSVSAGTDVKRALVVDVSPEVFVSCSRCSARGTRSRSLNEGASPQLFTHPVHMPW